MRTLIPSALLLLFLAIAAGALLAGSARGDDTAVGYVGFHIEPLAILSEGQGKALGTEKTEGNIVAAIIQGGPADLAGLKLGDFVLRVDGDEVPVLRIHDRYNPVHHQWRLAMRKLFGSVRLGKDMRVDLLRDGKAMSLTIHPVDAATMHTMQGGNDARVPSIATAGPAQRQQMLFEDPADALGSMPKGFVKDEGNWHLMQYDAAASGHRVLMQDQTVIPWAAVVAAGPGRSYTDGHAQVRYKTLSGITDASGGITWRAQDGRNYYLARANALEDNFGIYIMQDNVRTKLSEVRVPLPDFNAWHVIDVWFEGTTFKATLDGGHLVEAHDATFKSGYCGLWTKADSVTMFDDLEVTPAGGRGD